MRAGWARRSGEVAARRRGRIHSALRAPRIRSARCRWRRWTAARQAPGPAAGGRATYGARPTARTPRPASIVHRRAHALGHVGRGRVPVERRPKRAESRMRAPSALRASPSARRDGPPASRCGSALWRHSLADFGHRKAIRPAQPRDRRAGTRRRVGAAAKVGARARRTDLRTRAEGDGGAQCRPAKTNCERATLKRRLQCTPLPPE